MWSLYLLAVRQIYAQGRVPKMPQTVLLGEEGEEVVTHWETAK